MTSEPTYHITVRKPTCRSGTSHAVMRAKDVGNILEVRIRMRGERGIHRNHLDDVVNKLVKTSLHAGD